MNVENGVRILTISAPFDKTIKCSLIHYFLKNQLFGLARCKGTSGIRPKNPIRHICNQNTFLPICAVGHVMLVLDQM